MIYTIHRHVTNLDEYSLQIYIDIKLQPLIARYIVCYDYNSDVFCVYSVVENGLFPFLKIVNFPHVLVRKNAAFLTLIFHFHKMIYNYFSCSLFSFFFFEKQGYVSFELFLFIHIFSILCIYQANP